MTWISVKHRLPDIYHYVFVLADHPQGCDYYATSIARLVCKERSEWEFLAEYSDKSGISAYQDVEMSIDSRDITHWLPIPFPPSRGVQELKKKRLYYH